MSEVQARQERDALILDLPAAHSAGRMARQMVRQYAEAEGLPSEELQNLEFVSGELLDNGVDHGGGGGAREVADLPGDIRLLAELRIESGRWCFVVTDQGGGDPEELRALIDPPDGLPDLEDERGRGFFLLAQMVDELTVEASDGGGGLAIGASKSFG